MTWEWKLDRALQVARMVAWEADFAAGTFTRSDNALEVFGFPGGTNTLEGAVAPVHPDDRPVLLDAMNRARAGEDVGDLELRIVRPDGRIVWLERRAELVRDPAGQIIGVRGLLIDVTRRRLAEEARDRAEREALDAVADLHALAEHAPDVILRVDRELIVRSINHVMPPMTVEQVVGSSALAFLAVEQHARVSTILRSVLETGVPVSYETVGPPVEGGPSWYSVHVGPVIRAGEIDGLILIARNIEQRRRTEAQLMVTDRLVSLGTMAAGVAHEINNPLAAVVANVSVAQGLIPPGATELAAALRDAGDAAARVRDVIRDLKLFARAEEEQVRAVDVRTVLESTLRMAGNHIRHRARLTKELGDVPPVLANESRLGQVFLNLIINAAEAIPEGRAETNELRVTTRLDGDRVAIEIRDTGVGMSAETRQRLFAPFFTTKPIGEGTGLGLPICQRIVSALGGEIVVDSELGKGSSFTVVLPAAERTRATSPSSSPPLDVSRARVLVIDDEPMVTNVVRRILGKDHDVVTENSAGAALARLVGGERYDLILCDLMMPEMTGMDLHAELERQLPEQAERMTFFTGGAFTVRAREFLDRVTNPRMDKPFSQRDLRDAVAERRRG